MPSGFINVDKFEVDLMTVAKEFQIDLLKLVRAVALEGYAQVVSETPIDTGRAQNNWFVSVNHVTDEVTEKTKGTARKQAAAIKKLMDPYAQVYITNGLPYIERLENGWSQQAPSGMVLITLIHLDTYLAEQVKKLRDGQ